MRVWDDWKIFFDELKEFFNYKERTQIKIICKYNFKYIKNNNIENNQREWAPNNHILMIENKSHEHLKKSSAFIF